MPAIALVARTLGHGSKTGAEMSIAIHEQVAAPLEHAVEGISKMASGLFDKGVAQFRRAGSQVHAPRLRLHDEHQIVSLPRFR